MTISFRTRLFVVSALMVGSLLLVVLGVGGSSLLALETERLDQRLCQEARRLERSPPEPAELPRLELDVVGKLRLSDPGQLLLRFEPASGRDGVQSRRWDVELKTDQLDWELMLGEQRPAPPRGPRRGPGEPSRGEDRAVPAPVTCALASFAWHGRDWRGAMQQSPDGRSFVAADLAEMRSELGLQLRRALALLLPLALLLTLLGAWALASLSLRPVNRLREAMSGMTQKALDQRLPVAGEDREFKDLIGAYNAMLASLEKSFQQASRFSADAAHELKTPLTILQGRLEQAIRHADQRAIQSELMGLQDEVSRLADITRKLLLLSQADAGRLALHREPVDLSIMLNELLADADMLLDAPTLSGQIEAQLTIRVDALLLRQLLNNLLNNAVRYGRPGGTLSVEAGRKSGPAPGVEVIFSNDCAPISTQQRDRFFERFYRGDASHNRSIEGNGLGLSLAREIARAHGGDLTLEASAADQVVVRLWLPDA